MKPPAKVDREQEIEERAAPIIGEALDRMPEFERDRSGRSVAEFLRARATHDADVDQTVRRFIEYTLALRRRPA